jgi:hypothetical protein
MLPELSRARTANTWCPGGILRSVVNGVPTNGCAAGEPFVFGRLADGRAGVEAIRGWHPEGQVA